MGTGAGWGTHVVGGDQQEWAGCVLARESLLLRHPRILYVCLCLIDVCGAIGKSRHRTRQHDHVDDVC